MIMMDLTLVSWRRLERANPTSHPVALQRDSGPALSREKLSDPVKLVAKTGGAAGLFTALEIRFVRLGTGTVSPIWAPSRVPTQP